MAGLAFAHQHSGPHCLPVRRPSEDRAGAPSECRHRPRRRRRTWLGRSRALRLGTPPISLRHGYAFVASGAGLRPSCWADHVGSRTAPFPSRPSGSDHSADHHWLGEAGRSADRIGGGSRPCHHPGAALCLLAFALERAEGISGKPSLSCTYRELTIYYRQCPTVRPTRTTNGFAPIAEYWGAR